MSSVPDRIEKQVVLRAPRPRVWQALTDAAQFGEWFGVKLDGTFFPGAVVSGRILHPGFDKLQWNVTVVRLEPETLFSFRWHPFAIDPAVDYSTEPTTLIEFRLDEIPEGTRLTVTESGFDGVPFHRRVKAFEMNEDGWTQQMEAIRRYVTR